MHRSRLVTSARPGRGFAFIWVIFTVALVGLGLVVATRLEATAVRRDKERELLNIGREFRSAIGQYRDAQLQSGGARDYPSTLEDLLKDPRAPGVRRYLRKLYVDPMTGTTDWGLVRLNGRIVGVYSTSDRSPIKQAEFDAEEMEFTGKQRYNEWVFVHAAATAASQALPTPGGASGPTSNIRSQ